MMVTPELVRNYIAEGLPCTHLEVEGDGHHFYAIIVSEEFRGLSRIKQHQRVYAAMGERMRAEVHALSMQTFTPEQWAEQRDAAGASGVQRG
ncbi:MAG: BolA family transcriptional regulator [Burkholderiales bacterium]|nr:BolA family transcriptional regulator [Burkholderiales bacterium]